MRTQLTVLLGMALAAGCGDSDKDGPPADAAAQNSSAMDASSGDGGEATDAAAPVNDAGTTDAGSSLADAGSSDASPADAQVGAPDASVDAAAPVFVPCTGTKDVTVNIPSNNTSCAFVLSGAPTSPTYLTAKLDGDGLYQRMADGFYYEQGTFTLDGQRCDQAKDGQAHVLEVSLFCQ